MMNVTVICAGGLKESYYKQACDEYIKRLQGMCTLNVVEIKQQKLSPSSSDMLIQKALEKEAADIKKALPKGAVIAALCIEGKKMSSENLSDMLLRYADTGRNSIAFIIGSSYGLADEIKQLADLKISMSDMTFPHMLARVMLLEQIYRAFSISAGSSYHK
jgi:23S rRNA (pseudouridine1915-N3)-methyltransferase